jgi:hypothetical protein
MDDVLETLTLPSDDYWARGLEIGYDVLIASAEALLRGGFTVLLESTFTFVPLDGSPAHLHGDRIDQLRAVAVRTGADFELLSVTADLPELLRRRGHTGRLWDSVVKGTHGLHQELARNSGASSVDTTRRSPADVAAILGEALSRTRVARPDSR